MPLAEYAGMLVDDHGCYYARQRYYNPGLCCFMSIDPLLGTPGEPASHYAYAYAANNPYRYRDPMDSAACAAVWLQSLGFAQLLR